MSSLSSSGMKTSFSTNSSLYSTPCQSPGSLGSSLDSTHLSLQSKESLITPGPTGNGGLLAIQVHQDNYNINGNNQSISGSCSSASSLNSVRTLLPSSTTINNRSLNDQSKSINYPNAFWQDLYQLRQDLMLKLSGLRQQVQSIVHQLDEVEIEMIGRLNTMCQSINVDTESKSLNGTPEVNGTFLISPIGADSRKSVLVPIERRLPQLEKLIDDPALRRLVAMVKGYLTRRLMTTSKVKNLIKTIKDTTILLDNYRSEDQVAQEEIDFHRRLMNQLEKSLAEFHDVFFTQDKSEQMKLIARSRDMAVEKVLRLSTEARRLQAEKARKFVHDKRKDSPLMTNMMRVIKQSRKDEPEENEENKQATAQETKEDEKMAEEPQEKSEANDKVKDAEKEEEKVLNEKQNGDVEMEMIKEPTEEIEPKPKTKAKTSAKAKAKAPAKPRKTTKNTKKVSVNSEDTESSTNPSSTSPESAAPTPPVLSLPPTPEPTEVPDISKSVDESAPKRSKRVAATVKRVTRAAKKS